MTTCRNGVWNCEKVFLTWPDKPCLWIKKSKQYPLPQIRQARLNWMKTKEYQNTHMAFFLSFRCNEFRIWITDRKIPQLSLLFNQKKFGILILTEPQGDGTCDVIAAVRRPSLSLLLYKEKRDKHSTSNWISLFFAVLDRKRQCWFSTGSYTSTSSSLITSGLHNGFMLAQETTAVPNLSYLHISRHNRTATGEKLLKFRNLVLLKRVLLFISKKISNNDLENFK